MQADRNKTKLKIKKQRTKRKKKLYRDSLTGGGGVRERVYRPWSRCRAEQQEGISEYVKTGFNYVPFLLGHNGMSHLNC